MHPLISKQPKNPFMYHSAFKLSIYFNNNKRQCKPFHSVETSTTLNQVLYRKVNEIQLDRRAGYQYCIDLINEMSNKVHSALLFDAFEENVKLATFTAGKWRHIIEPDFSQQFIQVSTRFTVKNNFVLMYDLPTNKAFELSNLNF